MAPPKTKYINPILMGTAEQEDFRDIMKSLYTRLNDSSFSVVFKSLIVIHIMMKEGDKDVIIRFLAKNCDRFFSVSKIRQSGYMSNADISCLVRYADYLRVRAEEYKETGLDYVRSNNPFNGPVGSESLRDVESLERQVSELLKNKYSAVDLNNDVLMTAFKMLISDLLALYNTLNEGIIKILESFFELTRKDAQRTLDLYKRFVELTNQVVVYLKTGKNVGLKIPVIKHITTKLISSLEDHLKEDTEKGQVFNSDDPREKQLEAVREQKKKLEQQLARSHTMVLTQHGQPSQQQQQFNVVAQPTQITGQQTGYNPFAQQDGFSFENQQPVQPQQTSNPFAVQAAQATQAQFQAQPIQSQQTFQAQPIQSQQTFQAQPIQSQQTFQAQPIQSQQTFQAQVQPQFTTQPTGYYSTNQVTPSFTGAGFGGYTAQAQAQAPTQPQTPASLEPLKTGVNNPFSLDNMAKQATGSNPFSAANYATSNELATINENERVKQEQIKRASSALNPFSTGTTFGGLEKLPTIPVFPETQKAAQHEQAQLNAFQNLQTGVQQHMTGLQAQQTFQAQPLQNQQTFQAQQMQAQQTFQAQPLQTQQTFQQFQAQPAQVQPGFQPQSTGFNPFAQNAFQGPSLI